MSTPDKCGTHSSMQEAKSIKVDSTLSNEGEEEKALNDDVNATTHPRSGADHDESINEETNSDVKKSELALPQLESDHEVLPPSDLVPEVQTRRVDLDAFIATASGSVEFFKGMADEQLKEMDKTLIRTRYEKWLDHKERLEYHIKEYEEKKVEFFKRWQGESGDKPSTDEIRSYEREHFQNVHRELELAALKSRIKISFDLTGILKTVDEAMEVLKWMAPGKAIFIKPKELRDAVPLAAPGGVVDEVEVDKDVEMIQDRMRKAKKRALEELKKKKEQEEGNDTHKQFDIMNMLSDMMSRGHKEGEEEEEGEGKEKEKDKDKVDSKSENGLWYCTLIFPQLAKELVEISKDLVKRLGKNGAIAALNTALMEEALAVDKALEIINYKYTVVCQQIPNYATYHPGFGLPQTLRSYDEEATALGDPEATIRLARFCGMFPWQFEEGKKVLEDAIKIGYADVNVFKSLADRLYLYRSLGVDGREVEKYYRIASDYQPAKEGESKVVHEARLASIRIYALGLSPVPADPVYAAYLMDQIYGKSVDDADNDELLTVARMYRYALWRPYNEEEATKYYKKIINNKIQSHEEIEVKEAKEYIAKMALKGAEKERAIDDERKTRIQWLLQSSVLHPDIPDIYPYLADQYMTGTGVMKDMKRAKEYLEKGENCLKATKNPEPKGRLICSAIRYHLRDGNIKKLREYLKKAEDVVHHIPVDQRIKLNELALQAYRRLGDVDGDDSMQLPILTRLVNDGSPGHMVERAVLLQLYAGGPANVDIHDVYQCCVEAEKFLIKYPKEKEHLGHIYVIMGSLYMPDTCRKTHHKDKKNRYIPPIDREKARYYFQKSANLGEVNAWGPLGMTYHSKINPWNTGKNDVSKAAKCYSKAVILGECSPPCYFEYAYLLLHGRGIKQDLNKAKEYFMHAVMLGDDQFIKSIEGPRKEFIEKFKKAK